MVAIEDSAAALPDSANHNSASWRCPQIEFGWLKVKPNGFLDILARLLFCFTGRSATRQLRIDGRVTQGNGIVFEYDAKLHGSSIRASTLTSFCDTAKLETIWMSP